MADIALPKKPTLDSGLPIISAGNLSKLMVPQTTSLTQRYRRRDPEVDDIKKGLRKLVLNDKLKEI